MSMTTSDLTGRDLPIPFQPEMVRAILREISEPGTGKTQTRRILKPQPGPGQSAAIYHTAAVDWQIRSLYGAVISSERLPYRAGDRLWVRERIEASGAHVQYAADRKTTLQMWPVEWKRSYAVPMHMFRRFSRITLVVTEVRVQRLQEISEGDVPAEGLITQMGDGLGPGPGFKWGGMGYHGGTMSDWGMCFHTPVYRHTRCICKIGGPTPAQCAFREVWERINGPGSWGANPWVTAYTFVPHLQNIDTLARAA